MSTVPQQIWLDAPESSNTVRVRMIDTTAVMLLHAATFVEPVTPGHETLSLTDTSFLIEHAPSGRKALFDLGVRKDYWNLPPPIQQRLDKIAIGLRVDQGVPDILEEKGIDLNDINDIIWSHSHWDHTGDPSLFPSSTILNFGPGLTNLKPGYPEDQSSRHPSDIFKHRTTNEIDFTNSQTPTIGGFKAHDFYQDGSFYLLETPGHSQGHMCALARVTPPSPSSNGKSTFILLGGDVCHFCGDLRPNETYPLPAEHKALLPSHPQFTSKPDTSQDTKAITPWYKLSTSQTSAYDYPSPQVAQETVNNLRRKFDQAENVFVALAHDPGLFGIVPTFNKDPQRDLNDWFDKGWKQKVLWDWIGMLESDRSENRIVEGFWKDGIRYDTARKLLDSIEK